MQDTIIILASISGYVLFWCAVVFLISFVTGWRQYAARYAAQQPFTGKRYYFQYVFFHVLRGSYNGACVIGTSSEGIFIDVLSVFRPGHQPLFIPWSAITAVEERRWWGFWRMARLTVKDMHFPIHIQWRIIEQSENAPAGLIPEGVSA